MEQEYVVSLNKNVDYDQFWTEMESTTNAHPFVPDRRVDIVNNRDLSIRSCHYSLSDSEAEILRNDPRVACVSLIAPPETRGYMLSQTGDFGRFNGGSTSVNWGLRRCILENIEAFPGDQYNYTLDGTGVDIVIQDNGVMSGHPEWEDADGMTRFVQHDWFVAAGVVGSMPYGHYGDVGNHGTHVAGIAAGKTYGWAKGARIYSIRFDLFESEAFDLVKTWHMNKPIDPVTGKKRPTILNASWGYRWYYNNAGSGSQVTRTYRGTTTATTTTSANQGQITQYNGGTHNFTYTPADIDQEELTDAGVICVRAAGNYWHKIDILGGLDWDNNYTYSSSWCYGNVPAGQPIYYHRSGSPYSTDTILVSNGGNMVYFPGAEVINPSSERGPGVHVMAPGTQITSATNSQGFTGQNNVYPYDSNYKIARISGTSMAAPQVTGMLALFLQVNPEATAQQCKDWLANVASRSDVYNTGFDNDYQSYLSLMGQEPRYLYNPFNSAHNELTSGNVGIQNIWLR